MASRWKRVDLLRLSSVASSAAGSGAGAATPTARQRLRTAHALTATTAAGVTTGVTTPPFGFTAGPSADSSGTATFARRASVAQHVLNESAAATPPDRAGVHEDVEQATPPPCSPSRSHSPPRTRVSVSRLLCGTSLPWRSALDCFHELAEGRQWRQREQTDGDGDGGHGKVGGATSTVGEPVMPLEAVIAVYGMLLRNERAASQHSREDGPAVLCDAAESEVGSDSEAWRAPDAGGGELTSTDAAGPWGSPTHMTSASSFLARAAARHPALQPFHALLASSGDSGNATHNTPVLSPPSLQPSLLSLSTVLHVGLADVLRLSSGVPRPSVREVWRAVEVICHLQQYGWGPDYLAALSATPSTPPRSYDAAPQGALAYVQRGAHAMPIFTDLLEVLTAVWTARHAVRLGVVHNGQPSRHSVESSWHVGGDAATSKLANGEDDESCTAAATDVLLATRGSAEHHAAGPACDAVDEDEAVLRKVKSLAAVPTISGGVHATYGDATTTAAASLRAAHDLPLHQLTALTRHVVTFAWRAMCLRSPHTFPHTSGDGGDAPRPPPSPPSPPSWCLDAAALMSEEQDALLRLMRAATRFASFAELQRWLDTLAPFTTASHRPPTLALSAQQEAALLCVLTRAVRRAPSWTAACELLEEVWPRLPPAQVMPGLPDLHCIQCGGVAQVPALLEALLTLPHPLEQAGAAAISDCVFWARVVGGAPPPRGHAVEERHTDSTRVAYGPPPLAQQHRWSHLLFGDDAPTLAAPHHSGVLSLPFPPAPPSPSVAEAGRRHEARTRAALLLVQHRLGPAEALELTLRCLASSHAWCARLWAACLATAPHPADALVNTGVKLRSSQDAVAPPPEVRLLTTAMAATAIERLAEQHRTYCTLPLSSSERRDWLEVSLLCAPHGLARQLVLAAALQTRWSAPSSSAPTPAAEVSASLACAVPELAAVVDRWVAAPTQLQGDGSAASPLRACCAKESGDAFTGSTACIGDVGRLMADVQVVFQARGADDGAAATASLFSRARATVTRAGLRLEQAAEMGTRSPAGRRTSDGDSVVSSAPAPGAVGREERSSALLPPPSEALARLAQLRSWADLLCTSPTDFIADEACVVVWLYVLMRQVEELHGLAQGNAQREQLARALDTTALRNRDRAEAQLTSSSSSRPTGADSAEALSGAAGPNGGWSLEAEEALVRRVAQSLSAQLWPILPPTSLLPPMLLNWLLTRGGERTWGAAVRTLRCGASADAAHATTAGGAEADAHAASRRLYLLLALPLDRVVSVEHAVRVLRTLQVVEERCAAALAHPEAVPDTDHQAEGGELVGHLTERAAAASADSLPPPAMAAAVGTRGRGDLAPCPATDAVVADVYAQIERVLLREWYGRALAAVLVFFARELAYTFTTDARDAPHHAAMQLQGRCASGATQPEANTLPSSAGTWRSSAGADAATLCADGSPLLSPAVLHDLPTLREAPAWADALTRPSQVDAGEASTGGNGTALRSAGGSTMDTATTPVPAHSPSAAPATPAGEPTAQLRVPLHLLGTFILAECRVGLDDPGLTSPPATALPLHAHSLLSRRAPPRDTAAHMSENFHRAALSPLSALDSLDALLLRRRPRRPGEARDGASSPTPPYTSAPSTAGTMPSTTDASRRACAPARFVHPELLALYLRLVQLKKREAQAPVTSVEDAMAEVLKRRCAVEVLVEEDDEQGGPRDDGNA